MTRILLAVALVGCAVDDPGDDAPDRMADHSVVDVPPIGTTAEAPSSGYATSTPCPSGQYSLCSSTGSLWCYGSYGWYIHGTCRFY